MTEEKIEKRIVSIVIKHALNNGFMVSVYDGEEVVLRRSKQYQEIKKAMFSTGEDVLIFRDKNDQKVGFVQFIYGNGIDVISDCTATEQFDSFMKPIEEQIDKLEQKFS